MEAVSVLNEKEYFKQTNIKIQINGKSTKFIDVICILIMEVHVVHEESDRFLLAHRARGLPPSSVTNVPNLASILIGASCARHSW